MTFYNDDGKYRISNSEIKCFRNCQREWLLHYCWQWSKKKSPEDASGALNLGSAVHDALEQFYKSGEDPLKHLSDVYDAKISEAEELGYFEAIIDGIRKEGELAHIMVDGLLDWEAENGLDSDMELVGVEKAIEYELPNGAILRGKLDQQWRRADGRLIFRDWKTCKGFSDLDDSFLFNEQIKMYEMLERLTGREEHTDGAQFVMLKKVKRTKTAKPPFYKHVEVRPNKAEIESMYRRTMFSTSQIMETDQLVRDASISKVQYYCPPRPSRECGWRCPFYQVCPLMDDGSNWEGLLNERFEKIDPDIRYQEKGQESE